MANNFPCTQASVIPTSCCDVMKCIDIKSSDNSVTVEKSDCGVDIRISGNNIDQSIAIKDGDCISWTKDFINGVLTLTPSIDANCLAAMICGICNPPTCPAPIGLQLVDLTTVVAPGFGGSGFPYDFPITF